MTRAASLPSELPIERLTAICDTREQDSLDLSPLKTIRGTLATGDYSVVGLESVITIERKSLPDLLACVGRERGRFEREVKRLLAYEARLLVIESTWQEINAGGWRGKITPRVVAGSILGWSAAGLPALLVGSHDEAGRAVARFLYIVARRRWRESRALIGNVLGETPATVGEGANA